MTRKRKNTANRPSQSDHEFVTNSRGEKVRNVAYIPREKKNTTPVSTKSVKNDFNANTGLSEQERKDLQEDLSDTLYDIYKDSHGGVTPALIDPNTGYSNYMSINKFAQYYSDPETNTNPTFALWASDDRVMELSDWGSRIASDANYVAFSTMVKNMGAQDLVEVEAEGGINFTYKDYDDFVQAQNNPEDPRTSIMNAYNDLFDKEPPVVDEDIYYAMKEAEIASAEDIIDPSDLAMGVWKDRPQNSGKNDFDPDDEEYMEIYENIKTQLDKGSYLPAMTQLVDEGSVPLDHLDDPYTLYEYDSTEIYNALMEHKTVSYPPR